MKTIIIAEAGVNHNGSLKKALKMVDIASRAKADFIKFQTFIPSELCQTKANLAEYQKKNFKRKSQLEMLKSLSLSFNDFRKIKERCKKRNINFISSPFDEPSLDFLKKIKVNLIKIASGEITNIPLLKKIGKLKKKVIMSTGMSNLKEIKKALNILIKNGTKKKDITILHCNTEYPATNSKLNLKSIKFLKDKLNISVGYSDHSIGNEASLMAIALGSSVLEKHFTISKSLKGPDHTSSLDPKELTHYVKSIREFEKSLGVYDKYPYKEELKNLQTIRKQIVAKTSILKGEKFSLNNITTKRAQKGIPASKWDEIIGKKSSFNFKTDENIKF